MDELLMRAKTAQKKSKFSEAVKHYQKVLELDPRNVPAHEGLIESMYSLGDITGTLNMCNETLELDSVLLVPHIFLAYVYDDLGEASKSINEAKMALELHPNSPEALCCYGIILVMNKKYDKALSFLTDAIMLNPSLYLAHYNLYVCYYNKQDYGKAHIQARTLFKLKPNIRNLLQVFTSYMAKSALLRVSILVIPAVLYFLQWKIFLAIHIFMMMIYLFFAIISYKNKDRPQFTLNLITFAVFVIIDVMLVTMFP